MITAVNIIDGVTVRHGNSTVLMLVLFLSDETVYEWPVLRASRKNIVPAFDSRTLYKVSNLKRNQLIECALGVYLISDRMSRHMLAMT